MSLLQDVLRPRQDPFSEFSLVRPPTSPTSDDSDDELVNVMSIPGTPAFSAPPSRPASRPTSPTRRSRAQHSSPLALRKGLSRDPLKAFPTELNQRIFGLLAVNDLATCARVSKKWSRSQTLNYVWFQHYRKDNFRDESLPPGKWTRRESKQNWRTAVLNSFATRSPPLGPTNARLRNSGHTSGYASPDGSGYQTPRELREERWRVEEEAVSKPGKLEMREMYKDMGGRKARTKTKLGSSGPRDRGGWGDESW